jgi:hypothetical protein
MRATYTGIRARAGKYTATGEATIYQRQIEASGKLYLVDGTSGVPFTMSGPVDKPIASMPPGVFAGAAIGTAVLPGIGTDIGAGIGRCPRPALQRRRATTCCASAGGAEKELARGPERQCNFSISHRFPLQRLRCGNDTTSVTPCGKKWPGAGPLLNAATLGRIRSTAQVPVLQLERPLPRAVSRRSEIHSKCRRNVRLRTYRHRVCA